MKLAASAAAAFVGLAAATIGAAGLTAWTWNPQASLVLTLAAAWMGQAALALLIDRRRKP